MAKRDGTPLFSFPREGVCHVGRAGGAVRAYMYDGRFMDFELAP